jgi:hypothetical protein
MKECSLALTQTFSFGPATLWLSFLFFAFWLAWLMLFVGRAIEHFQMERERQRRVSSMLLMRHVAPAPAAIPQLVDPRSGIIGRRWGSEEEAA